MNKNRKRNKQIIIRTTEDEYKKIMEKVELSKMTMNRFFINSAIRKNIIVYDFISLLELSAQIAKIGNNINQIARKLNQGGTFQKDEAIFLKQSLEKIDKVLINIYSDINKQD